MTLMSRYNPSYALIMPSLPPNSVVTMVEKYRPVCMGVADFPTEAVIDPSTPA